MLTRLSSTEFERQLIAARPLLLRHAGARAGGLRYGKLWREDVVQQTMLMAFEHRHEFRGEVLLPWLITIMHNCMNSMFRKHKRYVECDIYSEAVSESDVAFNRYFLNQTLCAIRKMPQPKREAMHCLIAGMEQQQSANHSGVPVGTIKSRQYRARKDLEALL